MIWEGKGLGKVSARAYIEGTIPAFACCDWKILEKTSLRMVGHWD